MTEDIQNRILLTIMRIVSAPRGQDKNKFDRGKPIKLPTCYNCRKAGQLISGCPEKWRVAPKCNGSLAKTLSLTAVSEDTPPKF